MVRKNKHCKVIIAMKRMEMQRKMREKAFEQGTRGRSLAERKKKKRREILQKKKLTNKMKDTKERN